jgi:hypothetical protein
VVTACEPLSFLFYPFPVSHGTQIHECCMKFRNDLIVHCTLFLEKKQKWLPSAMVQPGTPIPIMALGHYDINTKMKRGILL